MFALPNSVVNQYDSELKTLMVPISHYADYKKWLRYFLDFCAKHTVGMNSTSEQVRQFLEKLREKKQSEEQRKQAEHAITLYYTMQERASNECAQNDLALESGDVVSQRSSTAVSTAQQPHYIQTRSGSSHYTDAGYQVKSDSPEWDAVLATMAGEIKVRHYSRKTLKTYALWSRQFQRFLKNKPPHELTTADVKEYLTFLAVKCKVASSTQNQAFNALLFLFRHGLKREFGVLQGVPRAKKSLYIPTVLSRAEIDSVLANLKRTHKLVVQLLFGCGLLV